MSPSRPPGCRVRALVTWARPSQRRRAWVPETAVQSEAPAAADGQLAAHSAEPAATLIPQLTAELGFSSFGFPLVDNI